MKEPEIIDYELGPYVDPPYCREATVEAIVNGIQGTFSATATSLGGGDWELDWEDDDMESTFEPTEDDK